jgi:Protein kinase domain
MSSLSRTNLDRPTRPIESGAFIDSFRVERVIATRPNLYTLVEAQGPYGEQVALTLLAPSLVGDKQVRRSVLGLARLRASIEHPHLLGFRGAVEGRSRVYLVSELAGPRTLADLLRNGRLDDEAALRLLGQIAGALETAATRGLTHRDLTPEAIVLRDEDEEPGVGAFLTDFGIAVSPAPGCDLLGSGDSAAYRSPEEVRGEAPESESNVYSLACILFQCLTGATPFRCDRPLLTLHAHIVEPPPLVSERRPDLPLAVDDVVARGMAKNPRERHPSPAELIRAAARALGAEVAVPVTAAPPQELKRVPSAPARLGIPRGVRRATAWIGVALFASAVSGFATGGIDWSGDPQPPPAVRSHAPPDRLQGAAYTQQVTAAVEHLRERRIAARKRLRAARAPAGQAAAARALAKAYRTTLRALPQLPATARGEPQLGDSLVDAERAYRKLATAARGRRPHAWRVARREALRREEALQHALRTVRLS